MTETLTRILIVDDDPDIRRFLRASLKMHQYEVFEAATGGEALAGVINHRPDLMVLDLGLPDLDGVKVTRAVREWSRLPIIVLSVRDRETDKIEALDAGADDYLTKPFGVGELLARIRVVLRRVAAPPEGPLIQIEGLSIDLPRHQVSVNGSEVALTPIEFDLLRVLAQNAGRVVTHRQLIHAVWGASYENESRLLRVNISNLRRKIEPDPDQTYYILTELGVGYRIRSA